jgi:hypothetical protein
MLTVLQDVTPGSLVVTNLSVESTVYSEDRGNIVFLLNVSGSYTKHPDVTFQMTAIL